MVKVVLSEHSHHWSKDFFRRPLVNKKFRVKQAE